MKKDASRLKDLCESLDESTLKSLINTQTGEVKRTAVHVATGHNGSHQVLLYLCEKGGDVNVRDKDNYAPLHYAAASGKLDSLRYLHETAGVDVNSTTKWNATCLHNAVYNKKTEIVKYLLTETSIDKDVRDVDGETAGDVARRVGEQEIVDLFDGETAGDVARRIGDQEIVDLFDKRTRS